MKSEKKETFSIVGFGASAGGFEAFSKLLEALPADTGMAFVFVQHLAPAHESALQELLAKKTKMRVREAQNNKRIVPNNIYVIPPNTNMTIIDGVLLLTPRDKTEKIFHPIDSFFRSLASACQSNAIGVVLSGTATDGTLGLAAIKGEGGITMAQDETAKYQDMPRSAISAGIVDFVLPPEAIARELLHISKHPFAKVATKQEELPNGDTLKKILFMLNRSFGVNFTYYKQATIRRRVMRRVMLAKFKKLEDYTKFIMENTKELDALYQDLLINVTNFFREPAIFKALTQKVFPTLLQKRKQTDPIRIWVAGCATGEEAYSLAIALLECLDNKSYTTPFQIFATDINAKVIEQARVGIYPKNALANVSEKRLRRFFTKIDGNYQISKSLREMCVFASHDFTRDPPFSRIDLISCQNVLIYLESILQKKALTAFHYSLKPDGFLLLGKSESVGETRELFASADKKHKIYRKKTKSSRLNLDFVGKTLPQTTLPLRSAGLEHEGQVKEIDIEKEAEKLLLSRYVPANVLINSDLEILQFRGETAHYLQPSSGRASLNLLKMVRDELEFELRNAIYQAKKKRRPIQKASLQINVNGNTHTIDLEVVPIKTQTTQDHFLILFKDTTPQDTPEKISPIGKRDVQSQRIAQLEQEQTQAREQMKSMHEEHDATNEELQSANEEVLSSNEELQSINEELETSKEELQSTNEELTTINDELQNRNIELKETRDYAEGIVETVHEPLIILNQDLRVRTANKMFYDTFQVIPETTEGNFIYELGNKQWDIPRLRKLLNEILPKKNAFQDFEVTHNFPSIGQKIMLLNARRLIQEESKKSMILLAIEDITDWKRKEALKESEARFRQLADSMPQIVWTARPDGYLDYYNKRWYDYTGFKKGKQNWKPILHPDDVQKSQDVFNHSIKTGKPYQIVYRFKDKKNPGIYRWFLERALPIKDKTGKIIKWFGTSTDIDEQKKALEHRDEFIGIASHELKTPLTSIKVYTQILQRGFRKAMDIKSAELVDKMDGQLDKLINLVSDLLDITKVEAGKLQLHESYFDFNELVTEIAEEMQRTTNKYKIIKELQSSKTVYGDRDRIGQVITNFISNAIKFSSLSKKIIVKTTVDREMVTLCVQDFGVGISKEGQLKVFERFYHADNSGKESYPGLGLGLYISSEIIKRHKGRIWVESQKGKGSKFYFSLPLKKVK